MIPIVFTDFRREMIARTLFDLLKIAVAAAFAGRFFFDSSPMIQWGLWFGMVSLGVSGFFFCPLKKPRG